MNRLVLACIVACSGSAAPPPAPLAAAPAASGSDDPWARQLPAVEPKPPAFDPALPPAAG